MIVVCVYFFLFALYSLSRSFLFFFWLNKFNEIFVLYFTTIRGRERERENERIEITNKFRFDVVREGRRKRKKKRIRNHYSFLFYFRFYIQHKFDTTRIRNSLSHPPSGDTWCFLFFKSIYYVSDSRFSFLRLIQIFDKLELFRLGNWDLIIADFQIYI